MPANPKYLTTSFWQKFLKLSSGLIGGYLISSLFHMVLILIIPFHKEVLITSTLTIFLLWVVLLILPYLFDNGWKVWLVYLGIILVLYLLYYLANLQNPFV